MAWSEGQDLPSLRKLVTQEQIASYANASGDANPIHLDPAYAAQGPFGRIVAHGMLELAFVSEMLTGAFGRAWLEKGRLRVRFRAPAYPGDQLLVYGQVTRLAAENGRKVLHCAVGCRKLDGQEVVTGEVTMEVEA
ncbi:MAG: MaoC family dehydratase [Chloroflexi bacterium]|nr:MaoC family dehydratase [Chloroflexota bacterium]